VRTYSTGVFMMTTLGFVLYGSMVLLPIFLQTLLGYPALEAGFAMLPRGLGSFLAMPIVGVLMSKFEPRKLLAYGIIVASYSLWMLSQINLNAGYWDIFWPQFIQGTAMGFLFVPLTTITHDPIPKEEMGNATSIFNVMRNIGGSFGIAAATTMVARASQRNINVLGANITTFNDAARHMFQQMRAGFMAQGADLATATQRAYAALFGNVAQQSAMISFVYAFQLMAIVFICCLPLVLLMRKPRHKGGPAAGAH
jgi:DHA2 family multidrug resistance protein